MEDRKWASRSPSWFSSRPREAALISEMLARIVSLMTCGRHHEAVAAGITPQSLARRVLRAGGDRRGAPGARRMRKLQEFGTFCVREKMKARAARSLQKKAHPFLGARFVCFNASLRSERKPEEVRSRPTAELHPAQPRRFAGRKPTELGISLRKRPSRAYPRSAS
jgi:hypothetical protein